MAHVTRAAARATAPVLAALARLDDMTQAQEHAIRGAVLDALLDGHDADHGSLAARAAALGIDGSTPARVVLLEPRQLREAVETALDQRSLPFLAGTRQDACVLLVQATQEDIRAAVADALASNPDAAAGVGRPAAGVAAVPDSLRDAEIVLERTRTDPGRQLLAFEDLDLATLVATDAWTERLKPKVDELIGELRAHQGLFDTLVAYFEHDLDVMRTSEAIGLHHNSLRYRLGRVEQVLGRSLKDPATIASLYIALTAHRHGESASVDPRVHSRVFVEVPMAITRGRLHRGWLMNIGIPTEIKPDERRVAITPAGARELTRRGHRVLVQRGAGTGSGYPDSAYRAVDAECTTVDEVFERAELVLKVKEPLREEVERLSDQHTLFTYLHLAADPRLALALCRDRCALHRLRDGRGRARTARAPRPDERDRGPARGAGRSDGVDRARRRARPADRRGAGRAPGRGPRPRRRRRRDRGRDRRGRHGCTRHDRRPLHPAPDPARRALRRARPHGARRRTRDRGAAAHRRLGDRRRARSRRPRPAARPARAPRRHASRQRAGRHLHRSGRLLRDVRVRRRIPSRPTRSTASSTTASPTCRARSPRRARVR